jgi:beta-glucosidase
MNGKVQELLAKMTLEEKASLCTGGGFFATAAIKRLGIKPVWLTDGPNGLRKQVGNADHLGLNPSYPATCFPSGSATTSSWDTDLLNEIGKALGEECLEQEVAVLLGPAVNMKRHPLCGRNFEYLSEDPFLAGTMGTALVTGVQSTGVGSCVKHFAANNEEKKRNNKDFNIDERTLHEIYLAAFEKVVREAKPCSVMSAYNRINGTYCSQNKMLLTDVLRGKWGFDGFVVSDWGAVDELAPSINAGLDLEMPATGGPSVKKLVKAVEDGTLTEEKLNEAAGRVLSMVLRAGELKQKSCDKAVHHELTRKAAARSMVLLKNDHAILPLKAGYRISVIGQLAEEPIFQGGGSAHTNPITVDSFMETFCKQPDNLADITFVEGYSLKSKEVDKKLITEAMSAAKKTDLALVFVGLGPGLESEGHDRIHLGLPENQNALVEAVAAVQKNVVVVLMAGSPAELPWYEKVSGIVLTHLGGEAVMSALVDVLRGTVNPSGRLAETWPMKLSDHPASLGMPSESMVIDYREGIFIGYRYYDKKELAPRFPFGFGLSYTTFTYGNISVNKPILPLHEEFFEVNVIVKNSGPCAGSEIVQLYVGNPQDGEVIRPIKELRGFKKITLEPGKTGTVTFALDRKAFAYYEPELADWYAPAGVYTIFAGTNSADLPLHTEIAVESKPLPAKKVDRNTLIGELLKHPVGGPIIAKMMGDHASQAPSEDILGMNNGGSYMDMANEMCLRQLVVMSQGVFTEEMMNGLIAAINNNGKEEIV